jgi:hypothetical protein
MNTILYGLVAFFLLVFIFLFYNKIKLIFYWFFAGRYSYKYFFLHKKLYHRNPYAYCIKEDFFDRIFPFFHPNKNDLIYKKDRISLPNELEIFSNFKALRRKKKNPHCFQAYNIAGVGIKIAGYRTQLLSRSAKQIFYFIDDIYLMTEFVIKDVDREEMLRIGDAVCPGCMPETQKSVKFFVETPQQETLFFRDAAFSLNLCLLNKGNPIVNEKISLYLSGQKESFDKINFKKKASKNKRLSR